jgi:hypothetical protein
MTPSTERMRLAGATALRRLTKTTAGGGRISSAVAPIPARRAIRDLPERVFLPVPAPTSPAVPHRAAGHFCEVS